MFPRWVSGLILSYFEQWEVQVFALLAPENVFGIGDYLDRVAPVRHVQDAAEGAAVNDRDDYLDLIYDRTLPGSLDTSKVVTTAAGRGSTKAMLCAIGKGWWDQVKAAKAAASGGYVGTLKEIVELAIDPHIFWKSVVSAAARNGHAHILKFVEEYTANGEVECRLSDAAVSGDLPSVKILYRWGSFVDDAHDAVEAAAAEGHINIIEWLIEVEGRDDWYPDAFVEAAHRCPVVTLEKLCVLHVPDFATLDQAFVEAAEHGNTLALEFIWLKIKPQVPRLDDALVRAAGRGYVDTIRRLVGLGAMCINTALVDAAVHGRLPAMDLLRSLGATQFELAHRHAEVAGEPRACFLLSAWMGGRVLSREDIASIQ